MKMDRQCFNEIVNLLVKYMDVPETRQAILDTAWYGSPLLHQVSWTGNPQTFTTLAVKKAIDFGQIEQGVPAIRALLEGLRPQVGYDVQEKIDAILDTCFDSPSNTVTHIEVPDLPPASNSANKTHLFISYSSADRAAFVDRLAKDLTHNGYAMWVDNLGPQYNGITAGKSWRQELADALNHASLVVFVITPDSIRSAWCQAELKRASEQNTAIIPVLARPIKGDDYGIMDAIQVGDMRLSDVQYRDFVGLGYDRGLEVLLTDIAKHLA
jgi:hypothetical protein